MGAAILVSSLATAQFRANDKSGVNVFETPKTEVPAFDGVKVQMGGAFSLPYMALKHSNDLGAYSATNANTLTPLANNFALPMASLNLNTALAEGVNLRFELYLASKHHNETWVKGGFIQFDKMPFIKMDLIDNIMKYTTLKVGQMDVNYGDAHFRRSDGGHAIYNTFMENYIMDEFATEIGAEADVHIKDFTIVAGMTNGELNPDLSAIDTTLKANKNIASNGIHNPSFLGKLAYDKQVTSQLRVRLSGSFYYTAGAVKNTLFGGDRTGSNYSGVMYNAGPGTGTAFNGRYNPNLTDKLATGMGNIFLKYTPMDWLSIESFSTYESAKGRTTNETIERTAKQVASDLIVRFGKNEDFFVGARYNKVDADAPAVVTAAVKGSTVYSLDPKTGNIVSKTTSDVPQSTVPAYSASIKRIAVSAGWYMSKNVMAKIEYVDQQYSNFPVGNINAGAKFSGLSAEAVIAF